MRDAFFFLSVAGLALSVAGFAGLVSAFRGRDQGWTRTELWRLRMIAQLSFLLVFLALVQFPLYALSSDEALVIRIASGLIVLTHVYGMVEPRFDPSNWPALIHLVSGRGALMSSSGGAWRGAWTRVFQRWESVTLRESVTPRCRRSRSPTDPTRFSCGR